jgi:acetoin utilization deacetylase AcuC-like enzyme
MALTLISSEHFARHRTPPGHPERVERAEVMEVIASRWRARGGPVVAPHPITSEQLERVHSPEYIGLIAETAGRAVALDPDTYTSIESHGVALLAAGAAIDAVERVMGLERQVAGPDGERSVQERRDSQVNAVLVLARPPGHHAERARAMGFCLFNNVAAAAAHARSRGARRVAIVDYDVHHGNGTQHIFETDPTVLFVSLHQFPFYPGTGAAEETGYGDGAGFTVNLPLEAGAMDGDYQVTFAQIVVPILEQFAPELLLVSAGFDAHERDPLAGMRLTAGAFGAMTRELRGIAERHCQGRMVLVTEGGYDLRALGESLQEVVDALAAPSADPSASRWPGAAAASDRGRAAAGAAKQALGRYWTL